jgi:hypothetical protein
MQARNGYLLQDELNIFNSSCSLANSVDFTASLKASASRSHVSKETRIIPAQMI